MATLNTFQQYSQAENTITNNVLLMFSMLYETNPRYYEEYINALIEENDFYKVIPEFNQQFNNLGEGFIDGHINIKPSTIIIETKINGLEWIEKLLKYTKSFQKEETKLLFHLSSVKYDDKKVTEIKSRIEIKEDAKGVKFFSLTYENLIEQLKLLCENYPYDALLFKLYNNFDNYCKSMRLFISKKQMLRAMACGLSYDLNVAHEFYFDLASRGYSSFKYLGIYKNKRVNYVAEVENMILANYSVEKGLEVLNSDCVVTPEQEFRLTKAINESIVKGWDVGENHRFFLLKNFTATNFSKISSGGIFRVRYFDLEFYCNKEQLTSVETIAKALSSKTWR